MKKRILLCAYNLDIGGIETSLVNLLNSLNYKEYDVTLLLQKKEGIFLNEIPKEVKIEEYVLNNNKNIIIRKIKNRLHLIKWIIKNKNKYDFAGLYATSLIHASDLVRYASKNNALWVHANYFYVYNKNTEKVKEFFDKRNASKFKKIVFVSNESRDDFLNIYNDLTEKCYVLGNIINYKKIIELSNEKIKEIIKPNSIIYVGRLDEEQKKISRLIKAFAKLKNKNYICYIIGDGPDKKIYEDLIKKEKLNKNIILLGKKSNPYPYLKKCKLFALTSDYEGFPVVLVEAMILQKQFFTTIEASNRYMRLSKYGKLINNDIDSIAEAIKNIMENKNDKNECFDFELYTKNIIKDLLNLMEVE